VIRDFEDSRADYTSSRSRLSESRITAAPSQVIPARRGDRPPRAASHKLYGERSVFFLNQKHV